MRSHHSKKLSWAIPLMLFAGVCVAIQGGLVKYTSTTLTIEEVFFGRTLFALAFALIYVLPKFKGILHEYSVGRQEGYLIFLRGGFGGISALLFYYSVAVLPVSTATMLYLTFPVFVPIISRIFFKIPMVHHIWWGLTIALIGIALVLQPKTIALDWRLFLGLAAGVLGAAGSVMNRRLHRYQSQKKILFEYFVIVFVISALAVIIRVLCSPIALYNANWLFLLVMGITAFLYQYCFSLALRYAPARLVTPCTYFSLIFTIGIDRVYWGLTPSLWELIGIGGIILGVILIMWAEPPEAQLSK